MDSYGTRIRALRNQSPLLPILHEEWKEKARQILDPRSYNYIASGAGNELTLRNNRKAFLRYDIVQRILKDVSTRNLTVPLFGHQFSAPVGFAPVGRQGLFHKDAELASAKVALALNIPYIHSMVATYSLEEIAAIGPIRWPQLFFGQDHDVIYSLIERAEQAGYSAIVVVFDRSEIGWRPRDLRLGSYPLLVPFGSGNFLSDPVVQKKYGDQILTASVTQYLTTNPSATWRHLYMLRKRTKLPIILKGILHERDVEKAIHAGVDGIIVSNHGGRHIDAAKSSLLALGDIVSRHGHSVPILFDSGIRYGADIFKAIALGARLVFIGRPFAYGLAVAGEEGVRHVMENLIAEFDLLMGNVGVSDVSCINKDYLEPVR